MAQNSTLELSRQLQQLLSSNSTDDLHRDVKRQACDLAHKIWLELEEPGDLIDRLVFQVYSTLSTDNLQILMNSSLKKMPSFVLRLILVYTNTWWSATQLFRATMLRNIARLTPR